MARPRKVEHEEERIAIAGREQTAGLAAVTRWVARPSVAQVAREAQADPGQMAGLRPRGLDWEIILGSPLIAAAVARSVFGGFGLGPDGNVELDLLAGHRDLASIMEDAVRTAAARLIEKDPEIPFDPRMTLDLATLCRMLWSDPESWPATPDALAARFWPGIGPSSFSPDGRESRHRDGRSDPETRDLERVRGWFRGEQSDFRPMGARDEGGRPTGSTTRTPREKERGEIGYFARVKNAAFAFVAEDPNASDREVIRTWRGNKPGTQGHRFRLLMGATTSDPTPEPRTLRRYFQQARKARRATGGESPGQ